MNLVVLSKKEIERFGEHVSLVFKGEEYTNVERFDTAMKLGNALKKIGVKQGDRVIIQMPNCPEVLTSFIALWSIGAVVVPINFLVGDGETAHIYRDCGARVIISSMDFWEKIKTCRKQAPDIEHVLMIDDEIPEGALPFHKLVAESDNMIELASVNDDDLAALVYTAGTTGAPKGVMHTHQTLYNNAVMQQDTLNFGKGLVNVVILPLCHSYGIASLVAAMVVGGGKLVLHDSFDIESIFSSIQKYNGNIMAAVPTMYVYMLLFPKPRKYDLSSMKYWFSGSAPLALETWHQFREIYGFEIIEGWGLTEAGANNVINPLQGKKKIGSCGLPMKGTRIKIADDKGNELPDGEEGEIAITGPMLMKGYWNKPEETADVLKDRWLYTGDVGRKDEDGYLYITDRKKDLIIKGGENISPKEIEEVLFSHPKVSEAAVIGMQDQIYGEEIKAFVVLKPGETTTTEEIIAHCKATLKRFKVPKEVVFINALPKNLIGKILKKELRKMATTG